MELAPKAPLASQGNRAFLRRVVRFLVGEAGITQLLDIGSGLTAAGDVSEVAHEINPAVHVVYADNDPVVDTHGKALLGDPVTAGIVARLRDALPAGSYLGISSFRLPGPGLPELRAMTLEGEKLLANGLGSGRWREDEQIRAWFGDWEMIAPGLVSLAEWRPDTHDEIEHDEVYHSFFGGVARKK